MDEKDIKPHVQGEFKLNVAAGMTYSSLRESRSRLYEITSAGSPL